MRKLMTLAVLCAMPALLHAQATSVPAAATPAKPAKEKKICRTDIPTGSIMMRTKCGTAQEWADFDAANKRGAEHALGRDGVGLGANAPTKGQ